MSARSMLHRTLRIDDEPSHVSSFQDPSTYLSDSDESISVSQASEIDVSNLPLYHRTEEVKRLTDAFDRVFQTAQSEVVVLSGNEGVGKTAIIEKGLRNYVVGERNCYLVIGKFDVRRRDPFGPIIQAFTDLLDVLGQNNRSQTAEAIQYGISVEDQKNLVKVLGSSFLSFLKDRDFDATYEQFPLNKLKWLFRSLLRAVASIGIPVTIVFDELQYANHWAFDLVLFFLSRRSLTNILFVCAHRDQSGSISNLIQLMGKQHLPLGDVLVRELDVGAVNDIVSKILDDQSKGTTLPLAKLVFHRTHGNCRFVLEFLQQLIDDDLLDFDSDATKDCWSWNLNRIIKETSVCEYVLERTKRRLYAQPHQLKEVLSIASLQGMFQFNAKLLSVIVKGLGATRDPVAMLQEATSLGFIEQISETHFQFTHGHVYEILRNSFDLLPENERAQMHLKIGQIIKSHLDEFGAAEVFLQAVDHLNQASRLFNQDPTELIEMNLRAGKHASKSSFDQAAEYLKRARNLTSEGIWTTNKTLAAEIYSTSAEYEFRAGNYDDCTEIAREILIFAEDLAVRSRAYSVRLGVLTSQGEFSLAFQAAMDFINQELREHFPQDPSEEEIWTQHNQAQKELSGRTDKDILEMPPQCEEDAILTNMLCHAILNSYYDGQHPKFMTYTTLRLFRLTLERGSTPETPLVLACYAAVTASFGLFGDGRRCGNLSLKFLEKPGAPAKLKARTLVILGQSVSHWSQTVHKTVLLLEKSCEHAIEANDISTSFFASYAALKLSFYGGEAIQEVFEDVEVLSERMRFSKQSKLADLMMPFWQLISKLMGSSIRGNPSMLQATNFDTIRNAIRNNAYLRREVSISTLACASLFENWQLAEGILCEMDDDTRPLRSHCNHLFDVIFIGVSCFEVYRTTRKTAFLDRGLEQLKLVQTYVNEGCNTFEGPRSLLEAMYKLVLVGHDAQAIYRAFDQTISISNRDNTKLLLCLACQRAAEFSLRNHRLVEAHGYANKAIALCKEWNATDLGSFISSKYGKPNELESRDNSITKKLDEMSADEYCSEADSITVDSLSSDGGFRKKPSKPLLESNFSPLPPPTMTIED